MQPNIYDVCEQKSIVVSTIASQQEGSWLDSWLEPLCGFSLGTPGRGYKNMHDS